MMALIITHTRTTAGMEGIDKARANAIILEASRNSKFYKRQLEKDEETNARIAEMLKRRDEVLRLGNLKKIERQIDAEVGLIHIHVPAVL